MVQSVSWSDPATIAGLLERTSPFVPRTPSRRTALLQTAQPKAQPKKSDTPSTIPPVEHLSDNPGDRLDALVEWTMRHHTCEGAFVADDRGLTLAARGVREADVSLIGPLLSALDTVRSIPGVDARAGALRLGDNMMSWVEVTTRRGGFCLGIVGTQAASPTVLKRFEAALDLTLDGI